MCKTRKNANRKPHILVAFVIAVIVVISVSAAVGIFLKLHSDSETRGEISEVFSETADEDFLFAYKAEAASYWMDKYDEELDTGNMTATQLDGAGKYGWNSIVINTGTMRDGGGECYVLVEFPDGFADASSSLMGDNRQSEAILRDATEYLDGELENCKDEKTVDILMNTSANSGYIMAGGSEYLLPINFSVCFRETFEVEDTDGDACCFFTTRYDGTSVSNFLREEKKNANLSMDVKRIDIFAADESNQVMDDWESVYESVCALMSGTFDEYAGIAVFGKLKDDYRSGEYWEHNGQYYEILKSNRGVDTFAEEIDDYTYRY